MRAIFAFVLVLGPVLARAEAPRAELVPVPAEHRDGSHLRLPTLNAVVDSPSPDWVWMTTSGSPPGGTVKVHSFVCVPPGDERRFVFSVAEAAAAGTEKQAREYVRGACESPGAKAKGYQLAKFESSTIPVAGRSWRYELRGSSAGTAWTWVGYIVSTDLTYSFIYTAPTEHWEEGRPDFERFVASFRFITPPKFPFQLGGNRTLIVAGGAILCAIGVLALGTCLGLAGHRSGPARTAGKAGCVLLLLAFLFPALLLPAVIDARDDAREAGQVYGRIFALTFIFGLVPAGGLALVLRFLPPRKAPGAQAWGNPSDPFAPPPR